LVAGNHDRCHPYNGAKAEGWVRRYTEDTGIRTLILTETNVTIGGTVVTVNHFPYGGDSHEMHVREDGKGFVDKFAAWRPEDTGGWLLHGHVHEKWRQRGRQINLGIDAWGGVPVHDDTIRAMMDAGPQDLPRFMWERKMKEEVSL
jgi:calcineurin-like phosphoesterase family protein